MKQSKLSAMLALLFVCSLVFATNAFARASGPLTKGEDARIGGTKGAEARYGGEFGPLPASKVAGEACSVLLLSGGHTDHTGETAAAFAAEMTGLTFDTYFVTDTPPTLAFLDTFDVVLLYEDGVYFISDQVGDVVHDYLMLNNGNLVYGTFYWQDRDGDFDGTGWGLLEGVDVFEGPDTDYSFHALGGFVPHALTGGVTTLSVDAYGAGTFAKPGTTTVAYWTNGDHFIGYREEAATQRQVAVSMFPDYPSFGGFTGDFYRVWENALKWAAAGAGRCPVNTLKSANIRMAHELFNPDELVARVRVQDQDGMNVEGAEVEVKFNLPDGISSMSALSNAQGWATFTVATAGGGDCSIRVYDITKADLYLYDPATSTRMKTISCP